MYLVFPLVYSELVYRRYSNANIDPTISINKEKNDCFIV